MENVWFKHVLRLTMYNKGLRKLLNCNSYTSVEKSCRLDSEIHISYTLAIVRWLIIDIKQENTNVTTERALPK